ncbi:STY4534 family ICE replication protein [Pasteurella multocida]
MTTQTSTQNTSYFNLHTTGIGYVNDIREVEPKKGDKFLACRIAALTGSANDSEYRYFDTKVVGSDAEQLIRRCKEAVDAKKKVLISFVMADLWVDTFTYTVDSKYHKKGDTGVTLKGRLIRVKMVKVDGELKYQEQPKQNQHTSEADA